MDNGYGDALNWLIGACSIIWLGLGIYLAFLATRQRSLARRIRQLEMLRHDGE